MKKFAYFICKAVFKFNNIYRNYFLRNYYKVKMKNFGESIGIFGKVIFSTLEKIEIGDMTTLNEGVYINGDYGVKIGKNCSLSAKCMIISTELDKNELIEKSNKIHIGGKIEIGDFVQIGAGSIILKDVVIGDNVIIGAGTVVKKNIPSNSIAYGNPLKIIKIEKGVN